MSPSQRDLVNKDRTQIRYQRFKIAKITVDRARQVAGLNELPNMAIQQLGQLETPPKATKPWNSLDLANPD